MASPCSAIFNVLDATHNSVTLGLTTAFSWEKIPVRTPLRGSGKSGEGCAPATIRRVIAQVKHLVGPPPADDAFGSLVLRGLDGTGATVTATIAAMLEDGCSESQDRDAPGQGGFLSKFRYKGDYDSDPLS